MAITLCIFSSCKKENTPEFKIAIADSAVVEQGSTTTISAFVGSLSSNATATATSSNKDFTAEAKIAGSTTVNVSVTSPKRVWDETKFDVTLVVKSGDEELEKKIAITGKAGKDIVSFETPDNCLPVRPGTALKVALKDPSGKAISADAASLCWQDNENLVSSVSIANGCICVETSKDICGNAVVQATKDGKTAWSWHIWATSFDPEKNTISYNDGTNTYTLLNVALGATSEKGIEAAGCFYQWGCKNPIAAASMVNNDLKTYYGADKKAVEKNYSKVNVDDDNFTLALTDPMTFYINSGSQNNNYGWLTDFKKANNDAYSDYWGGRTGKKSVADPCPAGYQVASRAALGFFTNATYVKVYDGKGETYDNFIGYNVTKNNVTTFIPTSGDIANTGALEMATATTSNTNSRLIALWSSDVNPGTPGADPATAKYYNYQAYGLRTMYYRTTHDGNKESTINPTGFGGFTHAYGFTVRCMKSK